MAKTKNRIKKMNFQRTNRVSKLEPLSDNDKYIIEMAGYKKEVPVVESHSWSERPRVAPVYE